VAPRDSIPLCVAALALVAFLPIRAIFFVYALMGSFADRRRAIQAYRQAIAATQQTSEMQAVVQPHRKKSPRKQMPE
jgi:membrane protein required for beta-lactamase induction